MRKLTYIYHNLKIKEIIINYTHNQLRIFICNERMRLTIAWNKTVGLCNLNHHKTQTELTKMMFIEIYCKWPPVPRPRDNVTWQLSSGWPSLGPHTSHKPSLGTKDDAYTDQCRYSSAHVLLCSGDVKAGVKALYTFDSVTRSSMSSHVSSQHNPVLPFR